MDYESPPPQIGLQGLLCKEASSVTEVVDAAVFQSLEIAKQRILELVQAKKCGVLMGRDIFPGFVVKHGRTVHTPEGSMQEVGLGRTPEEQPIFFSIIAPMGEIAYTFRKMEGKLKK